MIAFAAHWFVHVLATDHLSDALGRGPDMKRCGEVAPLADGLQLLYLLALGHQRDNRVEHRAHACRVQRCYDHHLALIRCKLTELSHLLIAYKHTHIYSYILKELTLIYTNDIIESPLLPKIGQFSRSDGF